MLSLDKVFDAQTVLKSIIRETNVVKTYGIAPDCDLYLKPENLQITGSFKVRGSAYKISQLSAEEKAKGVIACSAGNHAQGVALAATKNGIKSLICLPGLRTDLQGGGHKGLRRRGLPCGGRLRRRV